MESVPGIVANLGSANLYRDLTPDAPTSTCHSQRFIELAIGHCPGVHKPGGPGLTARSQSAKWRLPFSPACSHFVQPPAERTCECSPSSCDAESGGALGTPTEPEDPQLGGCWCVPSASRG